jgi:ribosomal protein L24
MSIPLPKTLTEPARVEHIGDIVEIIEGDHRGKVGVVRSWQGPSLKFCTISVQGRLIRDLEVSKLLLVEPVGKWRAKK